MPGKDLSRWIQNKDGSYSRRLGNDDASYSAKAPSVNATAGALEAAKQLGVQIELVVGTGKDGRITKADVEVYADA